MSGLIENLDHQNMKKLKIKKPNQVQEFLSTSPPLLSNYYRSTLFKKSCDVLEKYRTPYLYFTMFYTVFINLVPLFIVSIFNTLLIVRLYKSNDRWTTAKLEMHEQELSYKDIRDKKVQIENLKITWTLIIISGSFIILTLPFVITYFFENFVPVSKKYHFPIYVCLKLAEQFYTLNHSTNFFLYVLSRSSFRRVLKEKLKCDCLSYKKFATSSIEMKFDWDSDSKNKVNKSDQVSPQQASLEQAAAEQKQRLLGDDETKHNGGFKTSTAVLTPENYEKYWETFNNEENKKQKQEQQLDQWACSQENVNNNSGFKFELLKNRMKAKK